MLRQCVWYETRFVEVCNLASAGRETLKEIPSLALKTSLIRFSGPSPAMATSLWLGDNGANVG